MAKRKAKNPLALAVMASLYERPMHPYEIVLMMKERGKHESVRLRYSSLYSVVGVLEREGLVTVEETGREGRRPERTVYELTEAGREEFLGWLRELLRAPVKEYTQFAAGLSFLPALPPEETRELLAERVRLLEEETATMRERLDWGRGQGLPRIHLIEYEHELMLREAETEWVKEIISELDSRTFGGMEWWREFHAEGVRPEGGES